MSVLGTHHSGSPTLEGKPPGSPLGVGLIFELRYHFAPPASQSLLPRKVHPKLAKLLRRAFHGVPNLQSLLASPLQCRYLGPQVTLDGLQLVSGQPQLIFSDLRVLSGLIFFILDPRPRHQSMLQVRLVLYELLSQVPYLGLKASPLGCDAPKSGCPLTTRQPAENLYVSYRETHTRVNMAT